MAFNNGNSFHLAALLWRDNKLVRIGINGRSGNRFRRYYRDGSVAFCSHAETDAMLRAEPGDLLEVIRWNARGQRAMAKPCRYCQKLIRRLGVRVRYTNYQGKWEYL